MPRHKYPSDLTNKQWAIIEPLMPRPKEEGRPRSIDQRELVNAVFYLLRTGCAWRLLPHDFPNWSTVHDFYRRHREDGLWTKIHDALRGAVRQEANREETPSAAVMDSQSVKTTEKGGPTATTRARR